MTKENCKWHYYPAATKCRFNCQPIVLKKFIFINRCLVYSLHEGEGHFLVNALFLKT